MHRTAKSLELVKVEVYNCSILCPYLFLHKTLILCNVLYSFFCTFPYLLLPLFYCLFMCATKKEILIKFNTS